jgi:putative transposase
MSSGIFNPYTGYHNRRSIRLPGYDYSQPGYYFITICIENRFDVDIVGANNHSPISERINQRDAGNGYANAANNHSPDLGSSPISVRSPDLFGKIVAGKMILNDAGAHAHETWRQIPDHFVNVKLDEFIIMPDHVHGIVHICNESNGIVGANNHSPISGRPPISERTKQRDVGNGCANGANNDSPLRDANVRDTNPNGENSARPSGTSKTVGSIVRGFKIGVTKWFRQNGLGTFKWQRNYYEHIIRDRKSLFVIRKYIRENPERWGRDIALQQSSL